MSWLIAPNVIGPIVWTSMFLYVWPDIRDMPLHDPNIRMICSVKTLYFSYVLLFVLMMIFVMSFPTTSIWMLIAIIRARQEQRD
jgi:hypothetical protein